MTGKGLGKNIAYLFGLSMGWVANATAASTADAAIAVTDYFKAPVYVQSIELGDKTANGAQAVTAMVQPMDDLYVREDFYGIAMYRNAAERRFAYKVSGNLSSDGNRRFVADKIVRIKDGKKFAAGNLVWQALKQGISPQDFSSEFIYLNTSFSNMTDSKFYARKKAFYGNVLQGYLTGSYQGGEIKYQRKGKTKSKKLSLKVAFLPRQGDLAQMFFPNKGCDDIYLSLMYSQANRFFMNIGGGKKNCGLPILGDKLYLDVLDENRIQISDRDENGTIVLTRTKGV